MNCPFCAHADTQVVETRMSEEGDFVRRRRQCGACDKRFTTYERPDVSFPAIVKKDGRRIEYERDKLRARVEELEARDEDVDRFRKERGEIRDRIEHIKTNAAASFSRPLRQIPSRPSTQPPLRPLPQPAFGPLTQPP